MKRQISLSALFLVGCLALPTFAGSQGAIDVAHSTLRIYVYKTGIFSSFAHNHEIDAPIDSGEVSNSESPSVELNVKANKLRVLDPEASDSTRTKIQETMQSSQVLDIGQFPEIHFQSTAVEKSDTGHWIVKGDLALHGQTHPVSVNVSLENGSYRGSVALKQTQFGIMPVTIAGGTVRVKDEIKVEFSIALLN